jgi:hypothetical protein
MLYRTSDRISGIRLSDWPDIRYPAFGLAGYPVQPYIIHTAVQYLTNLGENENLVLSVEQFLQHLIQHLQLTTYVHQLLVNPSQ